MGAFYLVRGYKLPPLRFTAEEASALYLGADVVRRIGGLAYHDAALAARAKLDNVLPDSGGGQIDLGDFSVGDADVEMSGGGRATVNPSGRLDVDASGGSHVFYVGNPTLGNIDTSGGSSVERE